MSKMPDDRLTEIRQAMSDKVIVHPCLRCKETRYSVMEGSIRISLREHSEGFSESKMPVIFLTCDNCGYTFLHSMVVMNLVSDEELESWSYR